MDIQKQLLDEGIKIGMCEAFRKELLEEGKTTAELCSMYHQGLDFCIEHNFPSLAFINDNFNQEEIKKYGIYTSSGKSIGQTNVVALGNAYVEVHVPRYFVCDITLLHKASVTIYADDESMCCVSMYSESSVEIADKSDSARLIAFTHGDDITIFNKQIFNKITNK